MLSLDIPSVCPHGQLKMIIRKSKRTRLPGYLAVALTTLLAPAGKIIATAVAAAALITTAVISNKPVTEQTLPSVDALAASSAEQSNIALLQAENESAEIEISNGPMTVVLNDKATSLGLLTDLAGPGGSGPGGSGPGGPGSGGPGSGPETQGPKFWPEVNGISPEPVISAKVAAIPEPSTIGLFSLGLLALGWATRKKT